jgi:magnesium chelatase family protein
VLARVQSATVVGLDAVAVDVQVDVSSGIPSFAVVGLPDAAVREARERVRAAVRNTGFEMPPRRITVNLAPADTRKAGPAFDLPIAVGLLAATGQVPPQALEGYVVVGELALDGGVRPVAGVLSIALAQQHRGIRGLIVPEANAGEAAIVDGVPVHPVGSLGEVGRALRGQAPFRLGKREAGLTPVPPPIDVDFAEVRGQVHARRALEIAAAGAHNVLLIGPPGAGKTMLAQRLPTVLPPLTLEEAIEVTRIYSVGGYLASRGPLVTFRPFRAPHHSIRVPALIGGGASPHPGEASLAHLGVLFLDELPEFRQDALEALRQPLEEGRAVVTRIRMSVVFPTRCMLVAAMNPCPCGRLGDPAGTCLCSPPQRARYLSRLSGPLLDRIDLHVEVPRLHGSELAGSAPGEASAQIRERVMRARAAQAARARGMATDALTNGSMPRALLRRWCALGEDALGFLERATDRLGLSPRAYERIIRIARTIADLEGAGAITLPHVAEAAAYRTLDRAPDPTEYLGDPVGGRRG